MHTSRGEQANGAASDELLSSAAPPASGTPSTSSAANPNSMQASLPYNLPHHMVTDVGAQSPQVSAQHSVEPLSNTQLRQEGCAGHRKQKGLPLEPGHLRTGLMKASVLGKRHRRHPAHTNPRCGSTARSRLHPFQSSRSTNAGDGTLSAPLSPQLRSDPDSHSSVQCAYGLTTTHGFGPGRFADSADVGVRDQGSTYHQHGEVEIDTQRQDARSSAERSSEDRLSLALPEQLSTLHAQVQDEHRSTPMRHAFHLQPVPPARKRRKVSKGNSEVDHCFQSGALSHRPEHRLIRANIVPIDTSETVLTPPVDPPLRQMGITGAASQIDIVAQDSELSPTPERPATFGPGLSEEAVGYLLSACNSVASVRPATQHGWTGTRPTATEEADDTPSPEPNAQNHVRLHTEPLPISSVSSETRRHHRLQNRRATSLPNLNRWPTLDLSNPARHSFYVPEYVARSYHSAAPRVVLTPPQQEQRKNAASKRFEVDWPLPLQSGVELSAAGHMVLRQAAGRQLEQIHPQAASAPYSASALQRSTFDSSTARRHAGQPCSNDKLSPNWHQISSTQHAVPSNIIQPGLHPPITRQTLHELDSSEMLRNPQLRHDVVFDSHVQFRPNFDGERGRKVREVADQYWMAVAREVSTGCTCLRLENGITQPCICHPDMLHEPFRRERLSAAQSKTFLCFPSRIPILIHELRAILLSILPPITAGVSHPSYPILRNIVIASRSAVGNPQDSTGAGPATLAAGIGLFTPSATSATTTAHIQRVISQHTLALHMLDPAHISQEVKHGVVDLQALIKFLANILKLHCAPVRDHQVDRMLHKVCDEGDIVQGLRMCFEILELMKLDIANHQLRSARPWLVETAVDFETRWFREQIEQSKFTLERTSRWFNAARIRTREKLTPKVNVDTAMSRKEFISRAFNEGFLHILFEAPTYAAIAPPAEADKSANASGVPPSSSSINFTYTSCYPETFQFDAYRLITFHNDITDLTVAFMFLMLFRQLACSPLDDADGDDSAVKGPQLSAAAIRTQALLLAGNQADSVKNSIWCLVNEANAKVGAQSKFGGFLPRGASAASAEGRDGKGHAPIVFGVRKFDSPVWRSSIRDVLLQVAAQARAVQVAARCAATAAAPGVKKEADNKMDVDPANGSGDGPTKRATVATGDSCLPSAKTLTMLSSWMNHNLKAESLLFKLCRSRLREVILAILVDRLSGSPPASTVTAASAAAAAVKRKAHAKKHALRIATGASAFKLGRDLSGRNGNAAEAEIDGEAPAKRPKLQPSGVGSTRLSPSRPSPSSASASSIVDAGTDSDSSQQSLVQQQATSLRRLLSAQRAARSSGCSEEGVSDVTVCLSPSSPISIPTTPVPRSPLWTTSTLEERDWPSALTRSGLEPFAAEVRLLGDRISTLAAFHLRVFRNLYERLDLADRPSA
ncbi:Protein SOSEKI 1 [Tilletia horrida]|uniref:Protein SOSEKI 1 n=1 Tax=Tilletia horrida TaxID=155126 RepID=A0AAN6K002_9BASI|nr:Protein SOSEKI 1 [Tilletia horrida]KAK0556212.1 Protein SOSEKI 1 [Tilletia horrida]KAK0569125.1 Protein SOSEKI 1 [Tilletia horrida]